MGWRSTLGVVIDVRHRDRRWAWDVEIAVGHGFPAFGSDLGGDGGMGLGMGLGDGRIWIWAWVSGVWLSFC